MIICYLQWRQPYEITDCVSSETHLPTFRRRYTDAGLLIRPVRYLYLKTGHSVRKTSHYHMRVSVSDGRAFQVEVKLQQQDRTVHRLSEIIRSKKLRLQRLYALNIYDDDDDDDDDDGDGDDTDTRGKICYACQNVPQSYETKKPVRRTVFRAKH